MTGLSGLFDGHMHTQLAYCNDDMDVERAVSLAEELRLKGVAFTEHSGQLYFDSKRYWDNSCLRDGISSALDEDNRMAEYIKLKEKFAGDSVCFGLEADCDYQGNLLLKDCDRRQFDYVIGAMHSLPGLSRDRRPDDSDFDFFLILLEKLLLNRIDVLAHPFRVFRRSGWPVPARLFLPTAELLLKYRTAAEINFHTNEPSVEFIRICLDAGVMFSYGSDAHTLAEIGDFSCHLALLKEAGFNGDLARILFTP